MLPIFKPKDPADSLIRDIIPPHLIEKTQKKRTTAVRRAAPEATIGPMEDTPTIRILDIPTNATFHDLLDLVRPFNNKRANLPRDPEGFNNNRGVAYVSFHTHEDALVAKNSLNGHPYGNLILRTEWSRNYANWMNANKVNMKKGGDGLFSSSSAYRPR